MKLFFLSLLFVGIALNLDAENTYLYGTIENHSNKKIIVYYDGYNIVCNIKKKKEIKTDENGHFQIEISYLRYLSVYNYLKIKNTKIFFCIAPGDSLYIGFDTKNRDKIKFEGDYSERNIFLNDYYRKQFKRPRNTSIADSSFAMKKRYYTSDSLMLIDYKKRFSLDSFSTALFMEEIRNDYFNSLSISEFDFSNQYKREVITFDLNNEYLKYNLYYYSAIAGHIRIVNQKTLDLFTIDGLKEGLKYSDEILKKPYSENFKAYMIGYFFIWPYKKRVRENPEIKDIIDKFLRECSDEILVEEIKLLLAYKNVEL